MEQSKLPLSSPPKLTIKGITEKMAALDREVKYLVNKAKLWRPKQKSGNQTKESNPKEKVINMTEKVEKKVEESSGSNDTKKILDKEKLNATNEEPEVSRPVKEDVVSKQGKTSTCHQECLNWSFAFHVKQFFAIRILVINVSLFSFMKLVISSVAKYYISYFQSSFNYALKNN